MTEDKKKLFELLVAMREQGVEIPNSHVLKETFPNIPEDVLDKVEWNTGIHGCICGFGEDAND